MNKVSVASNDIQSVSPLFGVRNSRFNKGDFGTAVIVGGSSSYVGAPTFAVSSATETLTACGKAAMLSGAGRSTVCLPDFLAAALYPVIKYSSICALPSKDGVIDFSKCDFGFVPSHGAVAVGTGLGCADASSLIAKLIEKEISFVIDADGLKSVCGFDNFYGRAVLTPHVGEFARLCGLSADEIKNNAAELCFDYAAKKNCVLVLKDNVTYISDGKTVYENRTGNVKLAKGGSGDVLTGIICGLLAEDFKVLDAARAGSYILGRCAELTLTNEYSCLAENVIAEIPDVIDELLAR